MARKLASIQTISELNPIPGADKIEVASILGWKCVVRKGDYVQGQKIIYIETDALLPMIPQFEFLKDRGTRKLEDGSEGYKVKIIKLKGQVSQGLVMPISAFPDIDENVGVDTDVTEAIGIKLWQPIIPACLRGKVRGNFPDFIPKTDETRVQNLQRVITRNKGVMCYVTEKVDGSSITCYLKDGNFGICSRNIDFDLTDAENAYVDTSRKLGVEEKMRNRFGTKNIAIQGELIGHGIQGNRLGIEGHTIMWFNVFDIDNYRYYDFKDFKTTIDEMGLTTVPVLSTNYPLSDNIDEILRMSQYKSVVNPKSEREGIVIRPLVEQLDLEMSRGMSNGRLSLKAINEYYLLEEKD